MAELDIKWLQDKDDVRYFPVTHMNGVIVDTGGTTIGALIDDANTNINTISGNVATVDGRVTELSGKTITAGTGLTGGGAISANPTVELATLSVNTGYTGSSITSNTVSVDSYGRVSRIAAIIYSATSISSNETNVVCSTSITGTSKGGYQYNLIYKNSTSTDYTVVVSTSSGYITPDGQNLELTCKAGGYVELNFLNIAGVIYVRGV